MKNKKIFSVMVSLLLMLTIIPSVIALNQPDEFDPFIEQTAFAPLAPEVDGGCSDWDIRNYNCINNVMHYEQCQPTMNGGVWQPHSQVCEDSCFLGKCRDTSLIWTYIISGVVILILLIIMICLFAFRKKKRSKKRK